ncbi:MAG: restriction system-associated AAA family ATPase [Dysgonomonas sp.]
MKLVKLSILEKFRSLDTIKTLKGEENFTVLFREENVDRSWEQFHPFCFAGLNGSGKSNVLEALANIFYHLECCTLNPEYSDYLKNGFKTFKSEPIAYELEYYIIPRNSKRQSVEDYMNIIIRKEREKAPQIKITAQDQKNKTQFQDLTSSIRIYLPELVIGYSSGENEILSLPFVKSRLLQLDEYFYHLKLKQKGIRDDYDLDIKPESGLVYMDYHMSQAILLANFLLQDEDTLKPIKKQLDIKCIHSFRLVINDLELYKKDDDPELGYLLRLLDDIVDKLRKCATTSYKGEYKIGGKGKLETELLDFYVNEVTVDAFKNHFETPLKLFRAFQILSLLNMRVVSNELKKEVYNSESLYAMYKIPALEEKEHIFHFNIFKLNKEGSDDRMLLKAFSDGEHQFLHTMGICLMLKCII